MNRIVPVQTGSLAAQWIRRADRTEDAMTAGVDAEIVGDFEADAVKPWAFLARLDPDGSSDVRRPPPARLGGRLMDVAAAAEQRLRFLDEPQNVGGANLPTIVADVHAQMSRRVVDEPDAAADFIGGQLRSQRFEPVAEARFGPQILPQVGELGPAALRVHGPALAAELDGAGDEIAIGRAPVLVAERVVPNAVHPAEHKAILPVDLSVEVDAQSFGRQSVEEGFQRMKIVVAEKQQHRGRPGTAHRGQGIGQRREELPLAVESAFFGQ